MLEEKHSSLQVLLVDDDEEEFILTQSLLADRSFHSVDVGQAAFHLDWVSTYEEAVAAFEQNEHDVYLIDYQLGNRNGLELLQETAARSCQAPIILMTGHGSYDIDIQAMKEGATDYLPKGELTPYLLERTIRYSIERKRAEEKIRKHADRSEMLASLTQAFAGAGLAYTAVIQTVAHQVAESIGDICVIRILSKDGLWLNPIAYYHPKPDILAKITRLLQGTRQPARVGWAGMVIGKGEPLLIKSLAEALKIGGLDPWLDADFVVHSAIIVPLRGQGKLIGTMGVLKLRPESPFTEDDLLFFQDLADRAGLAIENARLYASEADRARQLDALHRATSALLSTIELESLLAQILDAAQSALPQAERGMLFLPAPDTGKLQMRADTGQFDPRIKKVRFPNSEAHVGRVVREKKPLLVSSTSETPENPESHQSVKKEPEFRSGVFAPLLQEEVVHGVIALSSSREAAFSENDLHLLESFAATSVAVIQNAVLHAEVQKMAITDSLTDFYNRRGFIEMGKREIERSARFARPLSIIMVDLDNFKLINDTHGHAAGDQVLRDLAERIRSSVREVDIIGRYGGDEYLVILPEADLFMACNVAERIRSNLEKPVLINHGTSSEDKMVITASLGVANLVADSLDLDALIARADTAAYQAKQKGRNRVEIA